MARGKPKGSKKSKLKREAKKEKVKKKRRKKTNTKKRKNTKVKKRKTNRVYELNFDKIRVAKPQAFDDDLIADKAMALKIEGQQTPIIVRQRKLKKAGGKTRPATQLVLGELVLRAAPLADLTKIKAVYIEAGDEEADLIRRGEHLWEKRLTKLERAQSLVAWIPLAAKMHYGQLVRNGQKLGRPPSTGVMAAARLLPILGGTVDARRKKIARAVKIDGITPEAKARAREAGLDDNEKALLAVASAGPTATAQLEKVAQLADTFSIGPKPRERGQQEDGASSAANQNAPAGRPMDETVTENVPEPDHPVTAIMQLEIPWNEHLRELWTYTTPEVRERFIAQIRFAQCKVEADARQLLFEVMLGRKNIRKAILFAYAKAKGVKKRDLQARIRMGNYLSKNYSGPRAGGGPWVIERPDLDWKNETKRVSDAELKPYEDAVNNEREKVNEFIEGAMNLSDEVENEKEKEARLGYYEI